jgi:hypothetical protein
MVFALTVPAFCPCQIVYPSISFTSPEECILKFVFKGVYLSVKAFREVTQ